MHVPHAGPRVPPVPFARIPGTFSRRRRTRLSGRPVPTVCVLLALAGLWSATAQAQTTTFVSNMENRPPNLFSPVQNDEPRSQPFRTGNATGGYTLHGIALHFSEHGEGSVESGALSMTLRESGTGGKPGNILHTLTNPSSVMTSGVNEFTAPQGVVLAADTQYHAVLEYSSDTGEPKWSRANEPLVSSDGWEIPNSSHRLKTSIWNTFSFRHAMAVKGTKIVSVTPPTLPALSIADASVDEGDSGSTTLDFTLTLDSAAMETVTVDWATSDGTATAGTDYTAGNGTLTINTGDSSGTVSVTVLGDEVDEPNETFTVTLTNPSGATLGNDTATGTITDDDDPPTVTLVLTPDTITEAGGGSTVTATLDHPSSESTTVTVTATPESPAVAGDYTLSANPEMTIPAGATTSTGTVTITAVDNDVDAPRKTVTVSATATNTQGITPPQDVTLTITDDENVAATGRPTIDDNTPVVGETLTATVDASDIDDPDGLTGATFTWQWFRVRGGTATPIPKATSATYTVVAEDVTFTLKVEATFTDDNGTEETVENVTLREVAAEATMLPEVSVMHGGSPITEGGVATFTFTRGDLNSDLSLRVHIRITETGNMMSESNLGNSMVLFFRDQKTSTMNYKTDNDDMAEPNSTVTVEVLERDGGHYVPGTPSMASVEVRDDDDSPATGTVTVTGTATEGQTLSADISGITDEDGLDNASYVYQWVRTPAGGSDEDISGATGATYLPVYADAGATLKVKVTVTDDEGHEAEFESAPTSAVAALSRPSVTVVSDGDVTEGSAAVFTLTRTGDTAEVLDVAYDVTASGDFGVTTGAGTATFPATGATVQVSVATTGDATDEADGSVTLTLQANPIAYTLGTDAAATAVVADDDDTPTVTLVLAPASIAEAAGQSAVTATLDHPSSEETTVTVSATPQSPATASDYTLSSNLELTIAAGDTTSTGTVTITAVDNAVHGPDKTVTVSATATNTLEITAPQDVTLTIRDDDNAAPTGTVTIDDTTPVVGETLTADASGVDDPDGLTNRSFTWQWVRVSGGTETPIAGATAATYTVVDADVGATLKVEVSFTDDDGTAETVESAETAAAEALPIPTVSVARVSTPVAEGAGARFTVTRTVVTTGALTVNYSVSETGAMVASGDEGAKTVDFADGDTEQTVTVPTVADSAHEADSVVTVTLTADAAYDVGTGTATVTVEDDDNAPATGAPTIDDTTPVVGETLTADSSGIADPDGLTGATFTWQWIRVSGSTETRISGATTASYTVVAGDVGATLKVEASFTDDDGTDETVESAETATVEAAPTLSIGDASVDEGDSGSATLDFTVTLSRAATATVTVDWATSDGTATAGTDYTAGNGTLTFNAGDSSQTVSVTVAGDNVDEPNETFTVTLTNPSGATIGDGTATGTITDDDDPPTVTLVLSPDSITEVNEESTVTATLDHPSSEATTVTVSVSPDSPAVAGDYTLSTNRVLTIAAGATTSTGTVTVTSVNNTVDAPHKTVTVSGTATNSQGVTAPDDVTLTIRDNDATPTVTLVLTPDSITEVNEQSTVTATLNHPSSEETTVTVSVSPVSPAVAGDYTLSTNRVLTIAAGATTSTGTVTVTSVNNTVDAPDKTVTVSGTATNSQGVTAPNDVTLTIRDNDATPTVTLVLTPASITEGGGTSTVTATLNHPSSDATTVTVSAAPVSPAVAGDYTLSGNRELTIAAGQTESTGTVTITGVDNDVVAAARDVTVSATATNSQGVTDPDDVTLTIRDDDVPGLSIGDASVAEGDSGSTMLTFTVTLNPVALSPVTVDWATADGTARAGTDYTAGNGSLTFNAGDSTKTVTVTVTGDNVDEPNETFTVTLSSASGAAISDGTATGTIRDDDDEPTVTLVLSSNSITEVDQQSTVTATLNHPSSEATTVTVSVAPVAPAVAGDYRLSTNRELTIAAGQTTSTGTVTITAVNNTVDAPHKTVTVSGTATNSQGVTDPDDVTLTIRDNDATPTVTLVLTPALIPEAAGTSTVTATLNHPSSEATTVTVSVAPVSPATAGDYTLSTNRDLTIAAGVTTSTGTVTVTSVNNTVDAPHKTVTVSGTATNSQGVTAPAPVTLTIEDDDGPPTVTLVLSPTSITEVNEQSTVTATLDRASGADTTVTVSVAPVAPAVAGDYTLSTNRVLTIAAGQTTSTGTVTVTSVNNTVDAPHKTVTVSGTATNSQGVTDPDDVTLTIRDNDATPTVTLVLTPDSITEVDQTSTVTATLNHPSSEATTVTVSVAPVAPAVAGDYRLSSNRELTIAAGQTTSTGTVTITAVNNTVDAPHKTVTVSGTATNSQGVTDPDDVTLTIRDNDATPTVTLVLTPASITEAGGTSTVTATLNHPSSEATTVTVSASPVAPTVAGDYTLSGSQLTIAAGQTTSTGTVTITGVDNEAVAADKDVTVSGTATNSQGVTDPDDVTLTIRDDDVPGLSIADASVAEGDSGSTTMTFTVTLNPVAVSPVTVDWATADGTARAGTDYTAGNGSLTFGPGEDRKTVSVTVAGDNVDEPNETFTVTLSSASGATIGDAEATGTIRDDDAEPTVTLVLTPASITEVDEESTVTATLNHPSSEATTVTVSVVPVAPAVAGDYTLSGNLDLTIAAGATTSTGTVTITAVNNKVDAPNKTVTVSGTATNSQGVTAPDDVTLTIRDNDATPRVTLELDPPSIGEDGDTSTVTATLDHPSSEATTVTVSAAPVFPAVEGDYTLSGSQLTIPAGATTSTGTVTITAVDNPVDTAHREVTVSGTATNSRGVTDPDDVPLTITNDDKATIELSVVLSTAEGDGETAARRSGPATSGRGLTVAGTAATSGEGVKVSEGAKTRVTVTATVTGDTPLGDERPVTIRMKGTVEDGAVGFEPSEYTFSVSPGLPGPRDPEEFTLVPHDDNVDETDQIVVVSASVGGEGFATVATVVSGTRFTLVDNDEAPTGIELCLTLGSPESEGDSETMVTGSEGDCERMVTVSEAAGETLVTVRATVTGDTRFRVAKEITVSVAGSDESGVVDVEKVEPFMVTIPAGAKSSKESKEPGTFMLKPKKDTEDEEDVTLEVSGEVKGAREVAITSAEVTVTDDDVVKVIVEDRKVRENAGAVDFEVTLDQKSVRPMTLTVTFQDGTATQGADYEPLEREVVFAQGDTKQTLRFTVVDDKLIEETETFQVTFRPGEGSEEGQDTVTATVEILDDETLSQRQRRLQYALAAFGRTVVQDLMTALEARQGAAAGGSTVTLGGTPVPSGAVSFEEVVGLVRRHVGVDGTLPTVRDFLARSHFQLALGEGAADEAGLGSWVLWGRGSLSRFAGRLDPTVATEGNVFAGQLGLEWRRRADLVAGVLVNGSEGAVEVTADVETEVEPKLLSLHPYVQWSPWAGLRTWGMLGYGWGEATVTDTSSIPSGATDLGMMMAAGGGSHTLASLGGLDWSLGTKGFFVEMETEAQAGRLKAVEAEAWQLRLLLEGRGGLAVGGAGLSGTVGLAGRMDGGDAEQGLGLELGGGVTYGHPGLGLDVTASGRVLLTHEATDFEDAGVSLAVGFDPGERGQGVYLALTPTWGNATSGVRTLWADRQPLAAGPPSARVPSALRLDAEVGYTMPWWHAGGTLTAYGAFAGDGRTTREYRVGQRLAWTPSLGLSLEADRRERVGGLPEHSLWLTGSLRY